MAQNKWKMLDLLIRPFYILYMHNACFIYVSA